MIFSEKLAKQYIDLKVQAPRHLLVMQVGAFMQVMNEGAKSVNQVTGLKLKMAGDPETPFVVGGFPKSGLDQYVGKLLRGGFSVAIALQDEEKKRHLTEKITLYCHG